MEITAKEFIAAMKQFNDNFGEYDEENKLEVSSYSGRGMYGENCIGIDVKHMGRLMDIAIALAEYGIDTDKIVELSGNTKTDNMGRGYIVYWPSLRLTEVEHAELMAAEYAEDEDELEDA